MTILVNLFSIGSCGCSALHQKILGLLKYICDRIDENQPISIKINDRVHAEIVVRARRHLWK